jgi:hypothetical protein
MQQEAGSSPGGVTIVGAALSGGRIIADGDLDQHRSALDQQRLLIFRGAFDPAEMVALRRAVQAWGEATEEFPRGKSASVPDINFHRRDDGTAPTSMPHIFHQYGFGNLAALPTALREKLETISAALLDFQNELAGTDFKLKGDTFRTKLMRHPRGGGFLVPHRHPYLPQRVSLFLNMSEPGVDYVSGGVSYRSSGGWIVPSDDYRLGDILAWRYDMIHDVRPVDPNEPLTWEGDDGFWIYALEMDEIHKASSVTE